MNSHLLLVPSTGYIFAAARQSGFYGWRFRSRSTPGGPGARVMERRAFISGITLGLLDPPLATEAQQTSRPPKPIPHSPLVRAGQLIE